MTSRPSAHTPENTILAGGVRLPAGSEVIADGKRVRLEAGAKAWQFTIRSSRLALGVPDHTLLVAERGEWATCSCAACVNRGRCGLVDDPRAVLAHHGLLPPADPGGGKFVACERCVLEDVCREHGCAHTWPRAEPYAPEVTPDDVATAQRLGSRLVPPADPGGAEPTIDRDEPLSNRTLLAAHALLFRPSQREGVDLPDDPPADPGGARCEACDGPLAPGESGTCPECRSAFAHFEGYLDYEAADPGGAVGGPPEPAGPTEREGAARDAPALDAALAAAGGWWSVSRSPGDWPVILTCNNCGATRGWQTEGEAARFIRVDGACRCDLPAEALAGPTPPAPGAARKPLNDHLEALYGPE